MNWFLDILLVTNIALNVYLWVTIIRERRMLREIEEIRYNMEMLLDMLDRKVLIREKFGME